MTDTPRSNELSPVVFMGSGGPDLTAPEQVERPEYLIRKGGYWYRLSECAYTTSAIQAGRYTLADAMRITYPNGPDGPRDGMEFYHERTLNDLDWRAYAALAAKLAEAEAERDALDAAWADRVALLEKAISEAGAERDAVRAENALLREAVIEAMEMDCAAAAWTVLRDTLVSLDKGAG